MEVNLLPKQAEFILDPVKELMFSAGYGAGKSFTLCAKIIFLAQKYPRSRIILLRKTLASLKSTTLKTLLQGDGDMPPVLPSDMIKSHHRTDRVITLDNESEIVYTNMDINAIRSMNATFIAIDEATEFTQEEWDACLGRLRLTNAPVRQLFGVTNPGSENHFLYHRFITNPPRDENGNLEAKLIQGATSENIYLPKDYVYNLQKTLFGVYLERYFFGRWVSSELGIYDNFDFRKHIISNFDPPPHWKRYRSIDFGYKSPFVCLWLVMCGDDVKDYNENLEKGDLILYREMYYTERTTNINAIRINEFSKFSDGDKEKYLFSVSDHDAGDRADLEANGIFTIPAKKDITVNIQKVRERLGNSDPTRGLIVRPRLYFFENTLCETDPKIRVDVSTGKSNNNPTKAIEEMMVYSWKKDKLGRTIEMPEDRNDHAMNALAYAVMAIDGGGQWRNIDFMKV